MIAKLDFQNSRKIWNSIYKQQKLRGPFFQYDWHRVWYETLGSEYEPLTLLFDERVIIPLALKDGQVTFSGGDETTDYCDAIGNESLKPNAWKECFNYLKFLDVNRIDLINIPKGESVNYFSSLDINLEKEDTTPLFVLPNNWDEYLSSLKRKWRKELKRKMNNFENNYKNITYECDGEMGCLISLMMKNEDKVEFLKRPGMEEYFVKIHEVFSSQSRIECLSVGGKLAASIYYFETEEGYLLYNSGFDKDNFNSAGFYLKALNIKRAIDSGAKTYNFLQGDERYKYEMGGKDFFVYRMRMKF